MHPLKLQTILYQIIEGIEHHVEKLKDMEKYLKLKDVEMGEYKIEY
jgi:hypothetical protein